jgi:signal transduction histidine kinase
MNLPHFLPNILLNLPTPASITQFSFMDMQPPALSALPSHAIVFIGNNATQSVSFRNNKDALQRTYIASSTSRRSLIKDGLPWHIFWAAMTSMFLDHKTIAVAPTWFILAACLIVATLIAFGIYRLGGLALAIFFILALLSPLANILSVRLFNLYIPMMPILIIGFVSFSATVFTSVTLSSYRKYRLVASEKLADETADIKQNFLQLISHNLNTPIAQLRGLLDLLALQKTPDQNIDRAQLLIDYLRLTVRAVLDANLPKTTAPTLKKSSLTALLEELMDNESHFFSRMGVELQIDKSPEDSVMDPWHRLWPLDQDVFSKSITYSALLISNINRNAIIGIRFNLGDSSPGHEPSLVVDLSLIKNGTDNLQADLDVMREGLRRYLANAQKLRLIEIRSTSFGLTVQFLNP